MIEWVKARAKKYTEIEEEQKRQRAAQDRAAVLEICAEVRDVFWVARQMNTGYEREAEGRFTATPPPSPSHS